MLNLRMNECMYTDFLKAPIHLSMQQKIFTDKLYSLKRLRIIQGELVVRRCIFQRCVNKKMGGAMKIDHCDLLEFSDCLFTSNVAEFGAAGYMTQIGKARMNRVTVVNNTAAFMAGFYLDGDLESNSPMSNLTDVNFTMNLATEWTGAIRTDHGGGFVHNCVFDSNAAKTCGAFFDFAWKPSKRILTNTAFINNTAEERAGAFCAFHIMHLSRFESCLFIKNYCQKVADSIYIESTNAIVEVACCKFDKAESVELQIRFSESKFITTDCEFSLGNYKSPEVHSPELSITRML